MATEATFRIPVEQFPLSSVFEQLPDATVELERIVPTQDGEAPYVWVRGGAVETVNPVFADHPAVASIEAVDSVGDDLLFRVRWELSYDSVLKHLTEAELTLIEAIGRRDHWTISVRGATKSALTGFQNACRRHGISLTVTKIRPTSPVDSPSMALLTDAQQEALQIAYNRGYFGSPREVTLEEIGAELGISHQAVASRLRRGLSRLVEETVLGTKQ